MSAGDGDAFRPAVSGVSLSSSFTTPVEVKELGSVGHKKKKEKKEKERGCSGQTFSILGVEPVSVELFQVDTSGWAACPLECSR